MQRMEPEIVQQEDVPQEDCPQLVFEFGYVGTRYSGFARQINDPKLITVQGEVERALSTLLRRDVGTVCAGRTDAGVHAKSQFVSFPVTPDELNGRNMGAFLKSLSALLPADIGPKNLYLASPEFSARFSALERTYTYRIVPGMVRPIFSAPYVWWYRNTLNVDAMARASQALVGEHDFKSFCKAESAKGKRTQRFVKAITFKEEVLFDEKNVAITVVGNAFLHSMVRTIVGSLVEVGAGHRDVAWIREALQACDRQAAGPCAPALGLTLEKVSYPSGELQSLLNFH